MKTVLQYWHLMCLQWICRLKILKECLLLIKRLVELVEQSRRFCYNSVSCWLCNVNYVPFRFVTIKNQIEVKFGEVASPYLRGQSCHWIQCHVIISHKIMSMQIHPDQKA